MSSNRLYTADHFELEQLPGGELALQVFNGDDEPDVYTGTVEIMEELKAMKDDLAQQQHDAEEALYIVQETFNLQEVKIAARKAMAKLHVNQLLEIAVNKIDEETLFAFAFQGGLDEK